MWVFSKHLAVYRESLRFMFVWWKILTICLKFLIIFLPCHWKLVFSTSRADTCMHLTLNISQDVCYWIIPMLCIKGTKYGHTKPIYACYLQCSKFVAYAKINGYCGIHHRAGKDPIREPGCTYWPGKRCFHIPFHTCTLGNYKQNK